MLDQYVIVPYVAQAVVSRRTKECEPRELSHRLGMHLLRFLEPLVHELDVTVDKRPLRTLVQTVEAIVAFRDRNHGLLLSELGDYMDGLGGGGGTKRLSTLIHHQGWKAQQIEEFLLQQADSQIEDWEAQGQDGLLIWDGTVLEKPESLRARSDCALSDRAKRCALPASKRATIIPPARPFLSPGSMGSDCCWRVARISRDRRGWRHYAGGRHAARWRVMSKMKTASSCACPADAGAIASSMCLIAAIVGVGGWEPCVASTRVLSCAGRPTIICSMHTESNKRRGKLRVANVAWLRAPSLMPCIAAMWKAASSFFL